MSVIGISYFEECLSRTAVWGLLVVAALLPSSGCGRGGNVPGEVRVYPVKGQITLEGRPISGGFVAFHSTIGEKTQAARPTAWADKEGNFSLTTFRGGDGAPAGEYVVTVTCQQTIGSGENAPLTPNLLPSRYSDPRTSDLHVRVAEGVNQPALIRLRR